MLVKFFTAVTALVLLVGCAGEPAPVNDAPPPPQPAVSVTGDDLSYRHQPLLTEIAPPAAVFDAPDPGESTRQERSFENAPPVIPHNVDGLLPITATENACAECHLPAEAEDSGATPIPASHMYDLRRNTKLQGLAGANYNCTQCHAPQADIELLVENEFTPHFRSPAQKERSNLLDTLNEGVK